MSNFIKYFSSFFIIALVLLLGLNDVKASHIVGGEITYRRISEQRFEIRLTLRRDCFNGSPEAQFDDPANIGVYDSEGAVARNIGLNGLIQLDYNDDDTLNEILRTECEVIGGDVCVHTTTYVDTITLPFKAGGYWLAYQRCCRNKTITNIVDPELVGATYTLFISEDAWKYNNSGPRFKAWPPVYVCGDRPIYFDHSAVDPEGDSIVYSLCVPYAGADTANSKPTRPSRPPYPLVVYKAPYSLFNLFNGNPPMTIDRKTGLLTGQPNGIGQYLVGVCISEYRNGRLLSQIRRDFQYNVRICTTNPVSNFDADKNVLCKDDRVVRFFNRSINAKDYTWYFDYPRTAPFSKDTNPTFTFPAAGKYRVALISVRQKDCIDTSYQNFYIYDSTQLKAQFDEKYNACRTTIDVAFTDKSFDSLLFINKWSWQFNLNGQIINSNEQSPMISFSDTGTVRIRLIVLSSGGCSDTTYKELKLNKLQPNFLSSSIPICIGEETKIISNPDNRFKYNWSPSTGLSCSDCPDPTARPDTSTLYKVTITDGRCTIEDSVLIKVSKLLDIDILGDRIICRDSFFLHAIGGVLQSIEWSSDSLFSNIIKRSDYDLSGVVKDKVTLYVRAKSNSNCPGSDSITIFNQKVETVPFKDDYRFCEQDTFEITLRNINANHNNTYSWSPSQLVIEGQGTGTIKSKIPNCNDQIFTIHATNQFNCSSTDTINVDIACKPKVDFRFDKNCDNTIVSFINDSESGSYLWDFGDGEVSTEKNPIHNYLKSGRYTVSLKVNAECFNQITKVIDVGFIMVNLNDTVLSCQGAPAHLNPSPDLNFRYEWRPATGLDDPKSPNPLATVKNTTTYTVRVIDTVITDCFIERSVTVFVAPDINLQINNDTILCYTDTITLQAKTDVLANIEWTDEINILLGRGYNLKRKLVDSMQIFAYATDRFGCSTVDSFHVVPIKTKYKINGNPNLCPDQVGYVEFTSLDNHKYSFEWEPQRAIGSGINSSRITTQPKDTTIYTVKFTNEYGCEFIDSFMVVISRFYPPLNAYVDDDTIYLGQSTQLHVEPGYTDYEWINPHWLSCSDCTDPIVEMPKESIAYVVTAKNKDGCIDKFTVSVVVILPKCDETDVYIPNAFSPNGDNNNDVFRIQSNFIDEVELSIYDRWGEKIFETKDKNFWWDGTYKGKLLPPDVYGYYFKVLCIDGNTYFKKGNVTLIR